MVQQPDAQRDLGYYFALAQTGLEMAAPVALGMVLDNYLGWAPWATAAGAVIGLAGGLTHMLIMLGRAEERHRPKPPRGAT
ncbi:MAG TPA: AtpZ/AtpI family protein [Gemmataceae bacterium]|nr:AtpZ/AtpI family protein [Gemmataceae bacterium]